MNKLNENITARFLIGESTEEDLREINTWLNQSEDNARELFKLEEIYHLGRLEQSSKAQTITRAEEKLFKRIEQEHLMQHKINNKRRWIRYAAMFIGIFLLSGLSYLFYEDFSEAKNMQSIVTQNEIKELELPDGTKIWLNKHTTLKYPKVFNDNERKVYIEGEGHFEVTKNPDKPFIVESKAMQVKVLGTVFNLKTDKVKMSAVATLMKGEIEVKGNHDEGRIILAPGQMAELNGISGRLTVKQTDKGVENWYNNEFVFEKADIYTIARTLESSYGVKLILAPDMNVNKTYSGTIKRKENVQNVLDLIKNSIPIEYKIVGNSVFLSSKKEEIQN